MPVFGDDYTKGFFGNKPCPRCSRLSVEGLAKVIYETYFWKDRWDFDPDEIERGTFNDLARAVLDYIREGR